MKDFTLSAYTNYLLAIKQTYTNITQFEQLLKKKEIPANFCIIRHDVDRFPNAAVRMARLENELGIKSTYYFRTKNHTLKADLIQEIYKLGHEIGYHYENLSDKNGDIQQALNDFEINLNKLRAIVPIKTIAMHGMPLKSIDNRELWQNNSRHDLLKTKFDISGEVYLDIDYSDIAYINDTGRNWDSTEANIRDRVNTTIQLNIKNSNDLLQYLKTKPHPKLIFQIHPERWADNNLYWTGYFIFDKLVNVTKAILKWIY